MKYLLSCFLVTIPYVIQTSQWRRGLFYRNKENGKLSHLDTPLSFAVLMECSCCAMTDNTSTSMRLNSSKQNHEPDWAKPEKNLPIICCRSKRLIIRIRIKCKLNSDRSQTKVISLQFLSPCNQDLLSSWTQDTACPWPKRQYKTGIWLAWKAGLQK